MSDARIARACYLTVNLQECYVMALHRVRNEGIADTWRDQAFHAWMSYLSDKLVLLRLQSDCQY